MFSSRVRGNYPQFRIKSKDHFKTWKCHPVWPNLEPRRLSSVIRTKGLVKLVKRSVPMPVFMMIRPRSGDFVYSELEQEQMKDDIKSGVDLGVDGFVTGAIRDGKVDTEVCRRLIAAAEGLPVTFHRAFDIIANEDAIEDIIELGFARILTSGFKSTAYEGRHVITSLIEKAGSKLTVLAGCGITDSNILDLMQFTKAKEYHSSGQFQCINIPKQEPVMMHFTKAKKYFGSGEFNCVDITDHSIVKGVNCYPKVSLEVVKKMKALLTS